MLSKTFSPLYTNENAMYDIKLGPNLFWKLGILFQDFEQIVRSDPRGVTFKKTLTKIARYWYQNASISNTIPNLHSTLNLHDYIIFRNYISTTKDLEHQSMHRIENYWMRIICFNLCHSDVTTTIANKTSW